MPDTPESWPPDLDALVAAAEHHALLLENVGDAEIRLVSVEVKGAT